MHNYILHAAVNKNKFSIFSGGLITHGSGFPAPVNTSGGHSVFVSGAGVVNQVIPHQAISGVAAYLYDSVVIARSGVSTIPESGRAILATVPANTFTLPSLAGPSPISVEVPYTSGIAVSAPSGTCGFTVVYTPGM